MMDVYRVFILEEFPASEEEDGDYDDDEESPADECEIFDEFETVLRIFSYVNSVVNDRCK